MKYWVRPSGGTDALANTPARRRGRQQEQVGLVPSQLLVVADPVDREAVAKVRGPALDEAHEREHAEQIERGKHRVTGVVKPMPPSSACDLYIGRFREVTRRPSRQTMAVLGALSADPALWRYGYELGKEVELQPGSLYPILMRLCDRGLLDSAWETDHPAGRPPRHLYRLTAAGARVAAELEPAARAGGTPAPTAGAPPGLRHRRPARSAT
jgi:PadR family transcriptional regulator